MKNLFNNLLCHEYVALDTETTGLQPHKKDTAFAVSVGVPGEEYYFEVTEESVGCLISFFDTYTGTILMHNAKFDMAFFAKMGCDVLKPKIVCTMATGRVVNSDELSLSLDYLGKKIGYEKDDTVKKYLDKNKLYEWEERPGKKKRTKNYHYDLVPRAILQPYAKRDAQVTVKLSEHQAIEIADKCLMDVYSNEVKLTKTLFSMEKTGIRIDRPFVQRAWTHEVGLMNKAVEEFGKLTGGLPFLDHYATLKGAFEASGEVLQYTEKGNPTFASKVLDKIPGPLARTIEDYRKAHVRASTYEGMLYYADEEDILHANARQAGCVTGRMSYSDPPLQCMEKVEKDDPAYGDEFLIRRSFVPRGTYFFVMMDFDQFEYRMMLNYARELKLIQMIKDGMDVHTATAEMMGVTRKQAKTINFMLLYGGGTQKLATSLDVPLSEAHSLKQKYFSKLPHVKLLIEQIHSSIVNKGFIKNWLGRRYYLPKELAYKAPNYLIQGGCADWVKIAMNRVDDYLLDKRSRLLLQLHDEILLEIHNDEKYIIPYIKNILENVSDHPVHSALNYTVGVDYSHKSWQDKGEWNG